jgi:hypothetical protein
VRKLLREKWRSVPAHIRKGLVRLYIVASSLWVLWSGSQILVFLNTYPYRPGHFSSLFWTLLFVPIGGPILFVLAFWIFEGFRRPQMDFGNLRDKVAIDIMFRPDIAAYEFLATGNLFGKKAQRVRLDVKGLSDEQKMVLPTEFYTHGSDGVDPNELCKIFGYSRGQAMVEHLAQLFEKWGYLDRNQMLNKVVDEELDRRKRRAYAYLESKNTPARTP